MQDGLTDLLYVLMPVLAQYLGLNFSQIGIIRAANRSAMTLFEIPSGLLSERFGERLLLSFGLMCVGVAYIYLSAASSFVAVLLCLFIAGFGAAFQHTLNSSVISKTYRGGQLRGALGAYNSSGDVGKLAFSGLFTLLYGIGFCWQGMVASFGVMALVAAIFVFVILQRLNVGGRLDIKQDAADPSSVLGWGIRNRTAFAALAMITFLDISVQTGFLTYVAFLMIEKELPLSLGAFAVILVLIGGVFGKFSCGFLAAKLGVISSLVLTELLTAIAIVAVIHSPTLIAYILLPLLGAVLQGTSSILYGMVTDLVHEDRQSRGFSVLYSIANGAAIMAPVGFGLIADQFGLTTAMMVMVGVVLVPLPLCLLLRPGLTYQQV